MLAEYTGGGNPSIDSSAGLLECYGIIQKKKYSENEAGRGFNNYNIKETAANLRLCSSDEEYCFGIITSNLSTLQI